MRLHARGLAYLAAVIAIAATATGCSGAEEPIPPPVSTAKQTVQSQTPDPAPEVVAADPSTGTTVKTDAHKHVEKDVGEKAGLIDEKTQEDYFTIEVTNTTLASECTPRVGSAPLAPTRGTFLILDISATLAADVADKVGGDPEESYMPLVAGTFSVATGNGKADRNVTSETAWGCFDDSVLLPPVVNPGQTVTGKLVLDVEATQGRVAYDPQENGGWSWPYGD